MKKTWIYFLLTLCLLTGCSHNSSALSALRTKWSKLKALWGDDTDGLLASEGFYGPIEDEFIPLNEDDLQFSDVALPQPKDVPGAEGSGIPGLNQFRMATAGLAKIFQMVHFNTDEYVLRKDDYVQTIDRIATYLKKHPKTYVAVAGHCDERGSEAYNLALGTRRSNHIRMLLVKRGVNPNNIHTVSYGKEEPLDPRHNASAWRQNRRVEFKLYEKP